MGSSALNPQQQKAVEAPHVPLLIVAGAGTGKTCTLTHRLAYLLKGGVPASRICALTFTNKAAQEMESRVRAPGAFLGTFHSFGARILRAEARELKRTALFTIFDDHDSLSAIKKVLKELDVKNGKPARFLQLSSFVKSGAPRGGRFHTREEQAVLDRYEAFLARNNAFDFDDLIAKTVWLFEKRPAILAKYQERYTHILVDEYQDVSPAQYSLVRLLAGKRRHISVVGDDAQMIYGWRYANLDIFLGFERDWPGARVMLLEENYRSTATIVQAASAVAAHNAAAREKNLWTRNPQGELLTIVETAGEDDEAEWIAGEVQKFRSLEVGKLPKDSNLQTSRLPDLPTIAILYRTNAQSRAIEQALVRRRIPYRIYGGLKFYERREVKDIVAGLRLAVNPRDEMSRERLGKTFRVRTLEELLPALLASGKKPPAAVIQTFLAAADYFDYLERETMNYEERRENVNELLRFAEGFTDLAAFLEHVALVQATDDIAPATRNKEQGTSVVHLSTIHLAKGLEFDRVFLAGCMEGVLPHARSMDSEDELEEERRLMYVGMTRARHELTISFFGIPSRFIGEIPPDLTAFIRTEESASTTEEEPEIQIDSRY